MGGRNHMTLDIGTQAPDFVLLNQRREKVSLADLKGTRSVIVFIPFAFTGTCEGELCQIRDEAAVFNEASARVVAITCNTLHSNAHWAEQQGFDFDLLSDFWPHGEVARAYDAFNETFGYAERVTYFLDEGGTITDVVASGGIGEARDFGGYKAALSK